MNRIHRFARWFILTTLAFMLVIIEPVTILAAADITINANAYQTDISVLRGGIHWKTSSTGYLIMINGANGYVSYVKTADGGATWGNPVGFLAVSTNRLVDSYADWEVPGDAGSLIHVAFLYSSHIFYYSLDTASDTLTQRVVAATQGTGTLGANNRLDMALSITKTRGGNLAIASRTRDNGGTYFYDFYISTNNGVDWTSKTTPMESATSDLAILYPANLADSNDLWALYRDDSASAISLKTYDDSANSWSEAAIGTMSGNYIYITMSGQIRHSDGHLITAFWNQLDNAAADLKVYDITNAGTITAKTDVSTDDAESAGCGVFIDQLTDDIYVSYLSGTTWLDIVACFYKKSTNGGTSWGNETAMQADAEDDMRWISGGSMSVTGGGRFAPVWYNDDLRDLFCNYSNSIVIETAAAPDAPTDVSATDGTHTDKVVITWTKSVGATGYKVYEGANLLDTLGDVATYNDTTAPAPTVTPGSATASDGTSSAYVTLSLSGASTSNGSSRTYKVVAFNGTGDSPDSSTDTGYRGVGALTYQWRVSAADSDASFSDIGGATTNPYNYTSAPSGGVSVTTELFRGFGSDWIILEGGTTAGGIVGRYYYCVVSAAGAVSQDTTHDRGYKGEAAITEYGFDYGLTAGYGSESKVTASLTAGNSFVRTIRGLTAGTVYHFRAKAYAGSWFYGEDLYVSTTGSPVIYEFLNTGGDGDSDAIYGANFTAQQFTAQTTSHTALYILLPLKKVGSPGNILVELKHATVADEPTGLAIASKILDGDYFSTSYLYWKFEVDEEALVGGAKYAIVVSAPGGDASNYVMWQMDTGGSLDDAVGLHSTNGGVTWVSDTPTDYLFEIWGNSTISIVSALAYNSYIESGDILFMLEYINEYPPYATRGTLDDPRLRFSIRLLSIDGLTVLASTPLLAWGDMPGSVYLSAAQASAITRGGAYYLEVYGLFTGNPSASYQLAPANWSGQIGGWVIKTAHNIENFTNEIITTSSEKVTHEILKKGNGQLIFTRGIPYLMQTHPELFEVIVIEHTFVPPTSQVAPLEGVWQDQVGPDVASVFTSTGTMFGIEGKYIGALLMAFVYFGFVASIGGKGGSPLIAAAIAFPVVGLGVWLFLIDFVLVAAVILVLAAVALIGYWVTRT